jgi:hypothetical protein
MYSENYSHRDAEIADVFQTAFSALSAFRGDSCFYLIGTEDESNAKHKILTAEIAR